MSARRIGIQRNTGARLGGGYKAQVLGDLPLGYWRLDEVSGTSMADSSGNGHSGTMTGSNFTLNQPGALAATDPDAKSVRWTGTGTYIAVATGTWMNVTTAASWELWIKPLANTTNGGIFGRYSNAGGAGQDWLLWYNTNNQIAILHPGAGLSAVMNMPQLNVWTHIVATYDGANLRLYCNGALVATQAATGNLTANAGDIAIGAYQSGSFGISNAYLDEVAFYGTTLSAARILAHYNAGFGVR